LIIAVARSGAPDFDRLNPPSSPDAARDAVHTVVSLLVTP
jgi:hypothetical protein